MYKRNELGQFVKGTPQPFGFKKGHTPWVKGKNNRPQISGNKHPMWIGGKVVSYAGYIWIYTPNHPFADNRNYVYEHRLVAEKCLGRYLAFDEAIHHINEDKADNHPKNLYLFSSNSKHRKFEMTKIKPLLISNII